MFNRKPTEIARRGDWLDPFALLTRFTPEFNEFFREAWPAVRRPAATEYAGWAPNVDVFERDNRLIARADLPGAKKDEVKVEVVEGWLTISGERKKETETEKDNFYRRECEYGTFYRAIPLPEGAKVEEVKAIFENGVLEVTVPLAVKAEVKPYTIAIEEPAKKKVEVKAA
jgi:HSP20 family protein